MWLSFCSQHQSDNCSIWAKANSSATLAHFNENVLYANVLHPQWCYSWIPNISIIPEGKPIRHITAFLLRLGRGDLSATLHPPLQTNQCHTATRPSLAENVASISHYVLCCFSHWQKPKHVFEPCLLVSCGLCLDNIHVSKLRIWQKLNFLPNLSNTRWVWILLGVGKYLKEPVPFKLHPHTRPVSNSPHTYRTAASGRAQLPVNKLY